MCDRGVGIGQAAVIGGRAGRRAPLRDVAREGAPGLGEDACGCHRGTSRSRAGGTRKMPRSTRPRQASGWACHRPSARVEPQEPPNSSHRSMPRWRRSVSMIGDEVGRGVVPEPAERLRSSGAALVEDDDAVDGRVEEAAMRRGGAGAGAAVQEQNRRAAGGCRIAPSTSCGGSRAAACRSCRARAADRDPDGTCAQSK